ncbi:hypothetical protein [Streptacidiphilus cavernicola]|uniref:STAS domain-containing protein n=1 Tax=Streptacidiphilus cavernicola TaxID=3342716 RepID=A0ABV6VVB5_9ACTN
MTYQDRRALHLHPGEPGQLLASVHGVVTADLAQRIADRLIGAMVAGIREVHVDVDQGNPLSAACAAVLFFPLLQTARSREPAVVLTVHRADSRTRSRLREVGLDRFLAYSELPV